jgi:hypothetical protein
MNSFKVVRVASEITGMTKKEIELLADLLVDNKNAEELQFQINVSFQEKMVEREEEEAQLEGLLSDLNISFSNED